MEVFASLRELPPQERSSEGSCRRAIVLNRTVAWPGRRVL